MQDKDILDACNTYLLPGIRVPMPKQTSLRNINEMVVVRNPSFATEVEL